MTGPACRSSGSRRQAPRRPASRTQAAARTRQASPMGRAASPTGPAPRRRAAVVGRRQVDPGRRWAPTGAGADVPPPRSRLLRDGRGRRDRPPLRGAGRAPAGAVRADRSRRASRSASLRTSSSTGSAAGRVASRTTAISKEARGSGLFRISSADLENARWMRVRSSTEVRSAIPRSSAISASGTPRRDRAVGATLHTTTSRSTPSRSRVTWPTSKPASASFTASSTALSASRPTAARATAYSADDSATPSALATPVAVSFPSSPDHAMT